ncbi:RnfABCDGE type electron transport complex subunit G [Tindallia californiensis]|uniref:Ion-translocating oxidoreductase complex subunit G n=1 Tax=Tindallia californiensis TaxID=159292 RepID=A0A1H3NB70_9FIRM|nr:RnfABCDGE type electron transport complex subunit G [Tindallia californiensis]SDY86108.1 electron transport complex protein RnfG [Tindallia californiensis]
MRDIAKMGIILLLITSVSGMVLGLTNSFTEGIIMERSIERVIASIETLIEGADDFEMIESEEVESAERVKEVYAGYKDGSVVGFSIKSYAQGYGGEVEVMVGITNEGAITGVQVMSQSETPGLGDVITDESFLENYQGNKTDEDVAVDTIGGATASSQAVNNAVEAAANLYEDYLKNL